jgi:ribosomal-protein-alanine N-acetyltransferase
MQIPTLYTDRLMVCPLSMDDLDSCHRLYLEIKWADDAVSESENLARRRGWLEWTIQSYQELDRLTQPPYGDRAVKLKESGEFAGLVGLVPLLAPFGQLPYFGGDSSSAFSAEVGLFWAFFPHLQRKGLATEAARVLCEFAFQNLNLRRILAGTERENLPSIAVMKRLGMRIEENPLPTPQWFQIVGVLEQKNSSTAS